MCSTDDKKQEEGEDTSLCVQELLLCCELILPLKKLLSKGLKIILLPGKKKLDFFFVIHLRHTV